MGATASAVRLVSGWLTPVVWLVPSALMLRDGPGGLWVGLLVVLAPLLAVVVGGARVATPPSESALHGVVLVVVAALLIWANLSLAGDVATALGIPRWHGVVLAAGPALVLALWRRVPALSAALLVVALAGMALPLARVAQVSGVDPTRAWQTLASREAFHFAPGSTSVAGGRDIFGGSRRAPVALDEEQRVSAPSGGAVRVLTRDVLRQGSQEWNLAPGQSVSLRPGDRLEAEPGTRLRFEAGRRVPGAPASGAAWAAGGGPPRPVALLALGLTLVGGAIALFAQPRFVAPGRRTAAAAGAALLVALFWAQGWTVYAALQAPDVFLGGVTLASVVEVPALALGAPGSPFQVALLVGLLAAFAAGSAALIERPGAAGASAAGVGGGADVGRDLGFWAAVFAAAAAASLWAVDPWAIALWALGLAASTLAAGAVLPGTGARASASAVAIGLAVFAALSALRWVGGTDVVPIPLPAAIAGAYRAALGVLIAEPVLAAVPASLVVRLVLGRLDAA